VNIRLKITNILVGVRIKLIRLWAGLAKYRNPLKPLHTRTLRAKYWNSRWNWSL